MEVPFKIKRPADLTKYILQTEASEYYLFFSKKDNTACCTCCGKKKVLSRKTIGWYQHNEKGVCPFCGKRVTYKDRRYKAKGLTQYGRILWFRKAGRVTFAQLDEYEINYICGKAMVNYWTSAQYRFCKASQEYYKHIPDGWWTSEHWEQRKNVKLPLPPTAIWGGSSKYYKTTAHPSWIDGIGSDLKYAEMDMGRLGYKEMDDPYALIGYIYNFLKYPSIEILEKAGFESLVGEKTEGYGSKEVNWRAKDLRKILKMNMKEIREFREEGGEIERLELYKKWKKAGLPIKFSTLRLFSRHHDEEKIQRIKEFISIERALKYLEHQGDATITDYADYLDECKKLGLDMKRKQILMPKKLLQEHKKTADQIKIAEDEKKKAMFADGIMAIYSYGEYRKDGLLIKPAGSIHELRREGQELSHCVRTYADKVCQKRCAILFIRKEEEPDTPYFTLELSPDGKIVQCRGKWNCSYPKEVQEFLESWEKDVLKKKKGAAAPAA